MIEKIAYRGWMNAYRITNGLVELIVLADVGPRVISYSFVGEGNQFYEVSEHSGAIGGNQFRLYGGHRLWISPEGPSTYYPDNRPVSVSQNQDCIQFTAQVESDPPGKNLQKELKICLSSTGSKVSVTHQVTNAGAEPIE